ncbi:glycosyl hydrolase [Desulforhopalus sp. 52FAK]
MIGQLFIVGFKGASITEEDPIYLDIKKRHLGGVILFDRHLATKADTNNITGCAQLATLTAQLQSIRSSKLFIAVDQEGGKVNRFRQKYGFSETPSAEELGKAVDVNRTRVSSRQTAEMLRSCGINLNLAPVVDLNTNRENPIIGKVQRSFSADKGIVYEHSSAWIEEHKKLGIGHCLKHFPGHGSSKADSHLGFVDITTTWEEEELTPYKELIKNGLADAIMVGHLFNQTFDRDYPATLSKRTVSNLLRKEMNFEGVIISDDMQMKAITDKYGLAEACVQAINAGVDLIIIGNNLEHDPEIFTTLHNAVALAVDNGILSENTIIRAYERIQQYKTNIG